MFISADGQMLQLGFNLYHGRRTMVTKHGEEPEPTCAKERTPAISDALAVMDERILDLDRWVKELEIALETVTQPIQQPETADPETTDHPVPLCDQILKYNDRIEVIIGRLIGLKSRLEI